MGNYELRITYLPINYYLFTYYPLPNYERSVRLQNLNFTSGKYLIFLPIGVYNSEILCYLKKHKH